MLPRRTLFALLIAAMLPPLALFAQLQPTRLGPIAGSDRLSQRIALTDSIAYHGRSPLLPVVASRSAFVNTGLPDSSARALTPRGPALLFTLDSLAAESRSASTAFVLSFLIAGGGQLYTGEKKKGVLLMLTELAGAGLVVHELATCNELLTGSCNDAKMGLGAVLALGSWIVSMADAPGAARRYNEKHARAQPIVDIEPGRAARFGARVALGR